MSRTIGLVGIFVLFLGLGGVLLYYNLASLTKGYIESLASEQLGTKVKIGSLDVSFKERSVSLSAIEIRNPAGKGYKEKNLLYVGSVHVDADILSGEKLVFNVIDVQKTNVNFEVKDRKSNVSVLKENLARKQKEQKKSSSGSSSSKKSDQKSKAKDKDNIKVIIKKFVMDKASMEPYVHDLGPLNIGKVNIPKITLTGIGQKENGILVRDAMTQVLDHILGVATRAASSKGLLSGDISKITGKAKEVEDKVKNIGKDVESQVKDLKSLFGK